MAERTRTRPAPATSLGGPDDLYAPPDGTTAAVTVAHGPYSERLPVSGLTIGEVRARYRDRFDIDPHSQPVLDGRDVDNGTVIRPGQVLVFVRRAGEKG
jgi:hypothetical protein